MGFPNAVCTLGARELSRSGENSLSDVISFTQMPADIVENLGNEEAKKLPAQEIHVILDVANSPGRSSIEVLGIKEIELANFWAGKEDDRAKKCRYLYRDPVSPASAWRYSPLYKLGRGGVDGRRSLLGDGNWREDKDSRFYKLYNGMLLAFEEKEVFSEGSADRLMEALVEKVDRLAELWSDKKRSYLLIFGLPDADGHFLYPADSSVFLEYFRARLAETMAPQSVAVQGKKGKKFNSSNVNCGICHKRTEALVNFDKVFAFATFDKKSFLPGLDSSDSSVSKVFPICPDCYRLLSEGRNVIDEKFLDATSIYGLRIYTIPELIMGRDNLSRVAQKTRDFLTQGLQKENFLSQRVLECDDSLVYHFIFWEKNQAQERLLLMVEDVPPTRLRRLDALWKETVKTTGLLNTRQQEEEASEEKATLWQAVNIIRKEMLELGGKNEADVNVLRDWLLDLLGGLLKGEKVNVRRVKELVVSRLQGLCSNSEWVKNFSAISARRWNAIVDFLYRANESLNRDTD